MNLPNIGSVNTTLIDGLLIRYASSSGPESLPIVLTAPWPESIYSFYHLAPPLAARHPVLLVDLPGFGLSQSRPDVMAPEAMGVFFIKLLDHFGLTRVHVIAPDVGTPAVLFAASKQPERFESLVIGGAAMQPNLAAGSLKDLIYSPPGSLTEVGSNGVKSYLAHAALLTPAAVIEDFRAASAGHRLEEATQFVRGYIKDCPILEPRLAGIKTPSLIIAGKNDTIVPPVNGQFLADRLPNNRYLLLDAEHRVWEEATATYNEAISSWISGNYNSII
ncbi:alpha/beta fold hydrolase [Dinghuibacter silviterrae]|uniref:Pimeloyl-ACP methyl ester carboxylesterase n=1 Tax=Dinghuibacter silviterrae TaxID=1539049 RepID=A0A4R8DI80_9BACT|nr:alpha/beta hydrolase [Dinghuibacter silviterrae]TDW96670.1 pimeloyl-ACP methyl ester carboxylesterase [Dinghuibacter silviterrae]